MDSKKLKGKYRLVDDFFPNHLRESLPVHMFLLREETDVNLAFDIRFYVKSKFHRNNKFIGGQFYKPIQIY